MVNKLIPIGCDHAGYELKNAVIEHLKSKGYEVKNFGTDSADSIDYPDYGHPVADTVEANENMLGIVICGSGNGINMTVNKHKGIRSALCWSVELAELARQHNNANILALPARFISEELGLKMVDAFLETGFEGGRHQRRVEKIPC
jgi:ribose 5-phosphate isomerase B